MHVRLALCFKDFACWLMDTSSVGLNVAGYTTAEVLRDRGIDTTVFPVRHNIDLVDAIEKYNREHKHPLTHVVISAPWLSVFDLESLLSRYPDIKFVVLSHSNVGFLQADSRGVELLRKYQRLEDRYANFRIGGNSEPFVEWMRLAYDRPVTYLPNLYPIKHAVKTRRYNGHVPLKIGAFGAVRPYKNFMTAAAAALIISNQMNVPVEFHMSSGGEGDQGMTMPAIKAMLEYTSVTLVLHKWSYWNDFIQLIKSMDLLIQVSYTESFNLVTADGILAGVPSVVSSAIRWAPIDWKADSDDALDVADVGMRLLKVSSHLGVNALEVSNFKGLVHWKNFLK